VTQTLSGTEIIADVLRRYYDFGHVEPPQPLPAAHQRRHRKLVVVTDQGKFLVKTYKRDLVILDALRFQHRLSDHLDQHGVPVARIKRTREGKGIVEMDDWAMEVQVFVEGEPMILTPTTLAVSAKALGDFHRVCRGFPCPPRDARMWRFSEVPRVPFQKLFEAARVERGEDAILPFYNEIALFLHDAARDLHLHKRSELETGLIHGDWHGGNLLFQGETLVAVVDLEFAGDGCYLEDIAYGLSNLCLRTSAEPEVLQERVNIMLDTYQVSRTLSFYEHYALYYAAGVKHVATVSYQLPLLDGRVAGLTAGEWIEKLALQCRWLSEQARKARFGDR